MIFSMIDHGNLGITHHCIAASMASICKQMSHNWIASVKDLPHDTYMLWYYTHCARARVRHRGSAWRSHSCNVHVVPGRPACGWRRETCACQVRIFEQWLHPRCRSTGCHNRGRKCHPWDSNLRKENEAIAPWVVQLTHWGTEEMAAILQAIFSKCTFSDENLGISIEISLKFVPMCLNNNILALVWKRGWRRSGDKPLSALITAQITDTDMRHSASMNELYSIPWRISLFSRIYICVIELGSISSDNGSARMAYC